MPRKPQRVMTRAGALKRLIAFIIDIIIVDIIIFPMNRLFSDQTASSFLGGTELSAGIITAAILIGLLFWAYFSLMEYYLGATIGMRLFKLQTAGKNSFANCVLRHAYFLPLFPFSLLWIIEPISILFKGRGLLEIITKTSTLERIEVRA